jgi:hypothetical protein
MDCSWRALAGYYYVRYYEGSMWKYEGYGGNQIDGMQLEEEAFKILRPDILYKEPIDLGECDLTLIDANLKNHLKI